LWDLATSTEALLLLYGRGRFVDEAELLDILVAAAAPEGVADAPPKSRAAAV
jgi:hypothetical protein